MAYRNLSPIRRPQHDLISKPFFFFSEIFHAVISPLKKIKILEILCNHHRRFFFSSHSFIFGFCGIFRWDVTALRN